MRVNELRSDEFSEVCVLTTTKKTHLFLKCRSQKQGTLSHSPNADVTTRRTARLAPPPRTPQSSTACCGRRSGGPGANPAKKQQQPGGCGGKFY